MTLAEAMEPIARIMHITSLVVAVLLCGCATRFTDGSFESEAVVDDIYDNAAALADFILQQ